MYHSTFFDNRDELKFRLETIKEADAILDLIIDPNESTEMFLFEQEKRLLRLMPCNVWNVYLPNNMELKIEKEFEEFLIAVSEHYNIDADNITLGKFWHIIEYLQKKNKEHEQRRGNN